MNNEAPSRPESIKALPPLTKKEVLRIIWKSFEFSQGTTATQRKILAKIRSYYDEAAKVDPEEIQDAFNEKVRIPDPEDDAPFELDSENTPSLGIAHVLAKRKSHAEVDTVGMLLEGDIKPYLDTFTSPEIQEIPAVEIAQDIWRVDMNYLKEGRPNRESSTKKLNTLRDPYFSFGVQYILRENSTSHVAFDKLFSEIRAVPFEQYGYETLTHMLRVILKYNSTHENTQISKEQIAHIQLLIDAAQP